ncbi:MAG: PstS family phosphate ABC transporter substrate-binding protein [Phycisphaerales bacterium]|jgi:phosphate transport system substrate-binding protein|nr:PstS family phosphate ABC transporter substrate-binding protein [Phycisphaerales bacterium]
MKLMKRAWSVLALALVSVGANAQTGLDPSLPTYQAVSGVSGSVKSMGSDTMNNLMTLWAEDFKKIYPNVKIEIEGKGSSTAPPALTEGIAQFGPMSRAMKSSEIDAFKARHGYEPTKLPAAIDCLAVFVHRDCPIDEISIEQLQKVFSVAGPDMRWGDLGVDDPAWKSQPISLYGRNSASGTYGFFKEFALGGNDYKATVKEQPGSSTVVQGISTDRFGMGYSGIGYTAAGVKALRVSSQGGEAMAPDVEHAYSGDYPLARFLYVYVNNDPRKALDPLRAEFVRFMFSREGQESVLKDGYYPVTADIAREALADAGL